MSLLRLSRALAGLCLAALVALVPVRASAQSDAPRAQQPAPFNAPLPPPGPPPSPEPTTPAPVRDVLETGAGIGFGLVGGFALGSAALVIACSNPSLNNGTCVIPALIGAAAGYALGDALGTWLAGNALGGRGIFWPTLAGSVAGSLSSMGVIALSPPLGVVAFLVLPAVGALLGYELSFQPVELRPTAMLPWDGGSGLAAVRAGAGLTGRF